MRILIAAPAGLFLLAASGCAAGPAASPDAASGQRPLIVYQLIIQFKANTFACDAAGIARLAADTGITMTPVRPMSGGACLVRHATRSQSGALEEQAILKQHPAIESLEQDRLMKAL